MKRRIVLATAVVVVELVCCASLGAQPMPYPGAYPSQYPAAAHPVLPPYEIVTIVRSKGFEPLGRPTRQGPTYWVRAADPSGREMQVIVDGRAGRILRIMPTTRVGGVSPPYPIPPGPGVPDGNRPSPRLRDAPYPADDFIPEQRGIPPAGPTGAPAPLAAAAARPSAQAPSAQPSQPLSQAPLPRPRPSMPQVSASAADPVETTASNPTSTLPDFDE